MLRNFLAGSIGDEINTILAGAAFNFRKKLNQIKADIKFWLWIILERYSFFKAFDLKFL